MLWKISPTDSSPTAQAGTSLAGRFVLHRHVDAEGPHLDLRLDVGPCLMGWRIDGADLCSERYALEKAPHPLSWLDSDGDAIRADAGSYRWLDAAEDGGVLELRGTATTCIRLTRVPCPHPLALAAIIEAMREHDVAAQGLAVLLHDGCLARRRALLRLCALGRELDGGAFDESRWHALLAKASLDEIHHHLRAYEIRFDQKYPPQPTSQPEPLPDEHSAARHHTAWSILQSA